MRLQGLKKWPIFRVSWLGGDGRCMQSSKPQEQWREMQTDSNLRETYAEVAAKFS